MAPPAGLEPATLCLEGRCSIQLSYGASKPINLTGTNRFGQICDSTFKNIGSIAQRVDHKSFLIGLTVECVKGSTPSAGLRSDFFQAFLRPSIFISTLSLVNEAIVHGSMKY